MKIVLTTRDAKVARKITLEKYVEKVTGGIIGFFTLKTIGATYGGRDSDSKDKKNESVVKINPSLSENEIKGLNDQEVEKMYAFKAFLEQTVSSIVQQNNSTLMTMCEEVRGSYLAQQNKVEEMYAFIHGVKPDFESSAGKKISVNQLAITYVAFIAETGVAEPTQEELLKSSKISQSTWSRAFRDPQFWKNVNEKIENLFNANAIVSAKLDKVIFKNKANTIVVTDLINSSEKKSTLDQFILEMDFALEESVDKIISPSELKRIDKLPKKKLIDEIMKARPSIKMDELEAQSEKILRRVVIALIV